MVERLKAVTLAKHYINICNTALAQHRDEFPYKQIIALLDKLYSGETLTFRIEDEKGHAETDVTTRFIDGQFTPIRVGEHDPDAHFVLHRRYLEEVLENAEEYTQHPAKLDLSWLHETLRTKH